VRIVGGVYAESCEIPRFNALAGSGLRAAGAIASGTPNLVLHTAIDSATLDDARTVAGGLGVTTARVERDQPVGFRYFTPMSSPSIDGPSAVADAIEATDDNILTFGLIESGRLRLTCRSLTVDPQRPRDLSGLDLSAADFERLAIVCNLSEIRALGGDPNPITAAQAVRARHGAEVVVVKLGAVGAAVVDDDVHRIGAHPTSKVFPIGSGDVFAGAFARSWGAGATALDAARSASASAAWWCGTLSPSVPIDVLDGHPPAIATIAPEALVGDGDPKVYLAGPFFDIGQRWLVELVRESLRSLGASVFSPLHDVGVGGDEVAVADLQGLNGADAVLALVDGWDPGTVYECGWAARAGIPIIALGNQFDSEAAKMLVGNGAELHRDLSTAVYRAVWAALGMPVVPQRVA
jgi:nucleoside 2-deoxyribosyltransferase